MSKVYDEFATMSAFRRVCKLVTNLKNPEIRELERVLRQTDYQIVCGISQFQYAELFRVLTLNTIAKQYCMTQRISSWEELISRCLWKEESDD